MSKNIFIRCLSNATPDSIFYQFSNCGRSSIYPMGYARLMKLSGLFLSSCSIHLPLGARHNQYLHQKSRGSTYERHFPQSPKSRAVLSGSSAASPPSKQQGRPETWTNPPALVCHPNQPIDLRKDFWWIPDIYGQTRVELEGTPLIDPNLEKNYRK